VGIIYAIHALKNVTYVKSQLKPVLNAKKKIIMFIAKFVKKIYVIIVQKNVKYVAKIIVMNRINVFYAIE
jgi:hypothetical protein